MLKYLLPILLFFAYTSNAQKISIHFNTGEATLSEKDKKSLDSLVLTFKTELEYHIKLYGHTDSIGSYQGNKTLSEKRAKAVLQYLSKNKNIKSFKVASNAYLYPIRNNATEEGRAKNRRCEIVVEAKMTKPENWEIPVQSFTIKNQSKNILYTKNGCKVIIEPGSFEVKENQKVNIRITEYNDPVDYLVGGLPMTYSSGGQTIMYQSEQMMKIAAYIDSIPVELKKLIGLQCPNIDTTGGVRFYEFRGVEDRGMNTHEKFIQGKAEEIQVELETLPLEKKSEPIGKDTSKTVAKKITPKKEAPKEETNETVTNEEEKIVKEKSRKSKRSRDKKFKIEPDTSRGFSLDPDTSHGFMLKGDLGRTFPFYTSDGNDHYCIFNHSCGSVCDTAYLLEQINYGLQFNNSRFDIPENIDFGLYYARYKSLAYDGMDLKYNKDQEKRFSVKTQFKKRFLHNQMILTIPSTKDNPELKAFAKTKWIISYGKEKQKAENLKNIKVSDLRIFRFNQEDKQDFPKQNYFIELKGDTSFYRFAVTAKQSKKTRLDYMEYEKLYRQRVEAFDDSLINFVESNKVRNLFCLYEITSILSSDRFAFIRCKEVKFPPCFQFAFNRYSNCNVPEDCNKREYLSCKPFCFSEWIKYYNQNMDVLQRELQDLKNNQYKVMDCLCKKIETQNDEPCHKWEHVDASPIGNKITMIGLGIYNFDREMAVEKKIFIKDAVYLNQKGDTILKCHSQGPNLKTICNHETFTIIPGFNGLLKQNQPQHLTLLPGKENMLYFSNYHRRYKIYIDLRGKETYKSNVFILKDITEATETLDGLRKELMSK